MTVADRIRERREMLKMSQYDLAKKLGLRSRSSITRIEKSGDNITLKDVERISKALDCSIQYLMDWDELPDHFGEKWHYDNDMSKLLHYFVIIKDKQALIDYAEYLAKKEGEPK